MMNFLNQFKKENGASSILVIIMMVVLMVFGLAVLTTSLSNVRLGERKQAWLSEYYELEAVAARELASIDAILLQAESYANDYMLTDDYIDDYMLDGPIHAASKARIFALAYDDAMMEALSENIIGNDQMVFYHGEQDFEKVLEGQPLQPSRLEFSVSLAKSNYDKHIQITVEILSAEGENLSDTFTLNRRYTITRHTQQQESFQYDEQLDFKDPFEEESTEKNPFAE